MKFQELPGIAGSWIDFTAGRCPELPTPTIPFDREFLHSRLERLKRHTLRSEGPVRDAVNEIPLRSDGAVEGMRRLLQSDAVAVVANMEAGIFGGALSQFLKCLTAVNVCRELAEQGINAVPVCWISTPGSSGWKPFGTVRILDARSEMRRLNLQPGGSAGCSSGPNLPFDRVAALIDRIETIGRDSFDPEIIGMLKGAYTRDATWSSACAKLISALTDAWGVVPVDSEAARFRSKLHAACAPWLHRFFAGSNFPGRDDVIPSQEDDSACNSTEFPSAYLIQSFILPVFARVVDPHELSFYRETQPGFEPVGLVPPVAWPAISATIIDARRRKILEKYAIGLQDLLKGEEEVLRRLKERMFHSSVDRRLDSLKSDVEAHIAGLNVPGMETRQFRKAKERCRQHVVYQLNKMKDHIEKARLEKQGVMQRHVRRAAGFLAPEGTRQENGLAGISFPLRYSRSFLAFLCDNLDVVKFEHQLIYLE